MIYFQSLRQSFAYWPHISHEVRGSIERRVPSCEHEERERETCYTRARFLGGDDDAAAFQKVEQHCPRFRRILERERRVFIMIPDHGL